MFIHINNHFFNPRCVLFWFRGSLDNLILYIPVDFDRMVGITEKLKTPEHSKVTLTGKHNGVDFEQKYTLTDGVWVGDEEYEDPHGYTIKNPSMTM